MAELTSGPAASFKHEIDGTTAVDVHKVDTIRKFSAEDLRGRYHRGGLVASKLYTKDGFGGVSTDQRPFFARRSEERSSQAHYRTIEEPEKKLH